jgi:hypothetical protein
MTNEEYKNEFRILKEHLVDNLAVYHERVTLLVQLTRFEIKENGVEFEAKIIKPLDKSHAEQNRLYKHLIAKDFISFSTSYQYVADDQSCLLMNNKVGRPYCPFTLWLDPELSVFVMEHDDKITKQIPNLILLDKDWKQLAGKCN